MNALIPIKAGLDALTERANELVVAAYGVGTQRAYSSGFRHYRSWCEANGFDPLSGDPSIIALYAVACLETGHAATTIDVRMAAISKAHRLANIALNTDDPRLKDVLQGIARTVGTAPRRQVEPITAEKLRLLLATCRPASRASGARDRAMLLVGFGAALRRSELCALHIGDVEIMERRGVLTAMAITIRKSKTDQTGSGARRIVVANPGDQDFCPATAFLRWMQHRRQGADGAGRDRPLFCAIDKGGNLSCERPDAMLVVRLIKDAAAAAGLDPNQFSGHSLRAGFATSADEGGASLKAIMDHLRHANPRTTAKYIRFGDLKANVSATAFGASG